MLMARFLLVLPAVLASFAAFGQVAMKTNAPPATVQVVGNGVFGVPQGQSIYVERYGNRILLGFPLKDWKGSEKCLLAWDARKARTLLGVGCQRV